MSIMETKYTFRGQRGEGTVEWVNGEDRKVVKPATTVEYDLGVQVAGLQAALDIALKRNAEYEKQMGEKA